MEVESLFGDLFDEKKGKLEFKSEKGSTVEINFTVAAGEDITGLEDKLKAVYNLLEIDSPMFNPKEEKPNKDEENKKGDTENVCKSE